jgi:hypothetical protein
MTIERDQVPRDQASIMAKIAHDVPPLLEARDLVDRFHEIMRQQKAADLDPWIVAAIASPLNSFAKGIIADRDAPFKPRSSNHGRTVRPKVKSQSSSW